MTTIAIDAEALELLAQELSSGMIVGPVLAKSLRELIAKGQTVDLELYADMALEIRATGNCRGKVHGDPKQPCDCRHCSIARRLK